MPDKFKSNLQIQEDESAQDVRVVKLDTPSTPQVEAFEFSKLSRPGEGDYDRVRGKFGALAATDESRGARSRKDARFSINPLIREGLKVNDEERRVIEARVSERISALEEKVRTDAEKRGYEDGLKRGRDEAFEKMQADARERLERFEALVTELEGAKEQIYRENERFLIDLAFRIGRMVLLRELATDRDYVLRLAGEIVEKMGVRENIRVRVHPDALETLGMLKEGLEKRLGALKNLSIEASAEVAGGGCQVETDWNAIDAGIDTQLQNLHQSILGASQ